MKKYILFLVLFLFVSGLFADELTIPFPCYPKKIQEKFAEYGMKLDLSGNDRTSDSWGFLENKGAEFIIYTYKPVTKEELSIIMKIVNTKEDKDGEINSQFDSFKNQTTQ